MRVFILEFHDLDDVRNYTNNYALFIEPILQKIHNYARTSDGNKCSYFSAIIYVASRHMPRRSTRRDGATISSGTDAC